MRRCNDMPAARAVAAVVGLSIIVAGCSDIYFDRRETIMFGADDALASNLAAQTIDPWPASSIDRRAPANGDRVAAAIKRYRTGRVFIPTGNATSTSYQQQQQQMMSQDASPATSSGASAATAPTSNNGQAK